MDFLMSAGFHIIRVVPRDEWLSASLLPAQILSACDCICPQFPGSYAMRWSADSDKERYDAFQELGLSEEKQGAVIEWATDNFGRSFGWPGIFYGVYEAKAAQKMFFRERDDIFVVGLGLPEEFADKFIAYAAPPPQKPGFAPFGESGWREVIKLRQRLPLGQFLGFELIDVEIGTLAHSWLCNSLETRFSEALGVRPNPHGFIDVLEDAKRCCMAIEKNEVGAEPGLWLPWGIVRYV